ncbi:putative RecA/RadA family phage recombinase [Comamonas sp. BIGb0124]|uniref:DUF2190 family protein n=1 Tax=Comamonas sp. BIGb0124 TaxID=2485130 RepID=UPI000F469ABC|nr:DUF2190 family protein [Comamonas sp. BIGb0124]ROR25156.1 putative RecA/RadA family phage recombinase [Comamonas sp. BIGb0124]
MARNFIQPGNVLDYVNTSGALITSGSVVAAGNLLGVALVDIKPTEMGSVQIDGVFEVPKVSGQAIAQGAAVLYDVSAKAFAPASAAAAAGDVSGGSAVAFDAAAAGATLVRIKFTGVPGAVQGA